MHLSRFGLVALGAAAVDAFRDTSPFFLASTSEVLTNSAYIKTGASLLKDISSSLSTCPSDYYVVVNQPGVHSSDFSTRKSAPRLGAKMLGKDKSIRSKMSVNEVTGLFDTTEIKTILTEKCKAQTTAIDGSYGLLADILERIPSDSTYTLLYATSPREFPETDSVVYESNEGSYPESIHMELKRDYSSNPSANSESDRRESLFDEYQFFTPGIFMGFLASFICIVILYIGISALSGLQIPYAAFERDTSAAIKKQQ
ncbi:BIG/ATPase V1 complex subunit S1 [Penicillium atrosanguineum]|uniref:Protein BIG1 n=1 Tax=Penicillium atrosanguineum TaxID=1132637 RepID=A0A9W9QCA5_9EURO|nr:BIG/ATPase V1 complex subunit S1 [Penicillium atrosanguineum]